MSGESLPSTLVEARVSLLTGACTSTALLHHCLEQIDAPQGQGQRAFITVHRERALVEAAAGDAARAKGAGLGALAGIPVSVKDLFDEAGYTTTAGSLVLRGAAPASRDADVVARLRAAGAILVGRTNMTEFAYSGVGLNPHYGTPLAPYDRRTGRIPGGSTSGGAVAVADGMCVAALGSDTGGSVRIPAAFCGLVGFKPSADRLPTAGGFPLAPSFDSVGFIARTVADCAAIDAALRPVGCEGEARDVTTLAIGIAAGMPFHDLDADVGAAVERAILSLDRAGATLHNIQDVDWSAPGRLLGAGKITAVESRACHGALFERCAEYDPRVAARIEPGSRVMAVDYARALQSIFRLRREIAERIRQFDVLVLPTVSCVPPPVAALASDHDYFRINDRVLRNTAIANILGLCALSLPLHRGTEAPVGLMLMAGAGQDAVLLQVAKTVEAVLAR